MLHASLEIETEREYAKILTKSLKPDSLDWCNCFFENNKFFVEINAKKVGTILYTIDDYLLNIKVALEVLNAIERSNYGDF